MGDGRVNNRVNMVVCPTTGLHVHAISYKTDATYEIQQAASKYVCTVRD